MATSSLFLHGPKGSELGRGLLRARGDGTRAQKAFECAGYAVVDVEYVGGAILKIPRVVDWILKLWKS